MVLAPIATEPTRTLKMSWEDFLTTEFEGIGEWVDGEVRVDMAVTDEHSRVTLFLIELFRLYARITRSVQVRAEPFTMRTMPGKPGRLPDIFLVLEENRARIRRTFLDGPADLVVEAISLESADRDRTEKFHEYEDGGIPEYWIIDPRPGYERADFYVLASDPVRPGRMAYRPVPINDDGTYHSTVLKGFWIRVGWLWDEQAEPLRCLAEMVGRERVLALID